MADFQFDEDKSFADNCQALLDTLESEDPEMAAILRANWEALVSIVGEGERDPKARAEFNAKVAAALDALATAQPKEGA